MATDMTPRELMDHAAKAYNMLLEEAKSARNACSKGSEDRAMLNGLIRHVKVQGISLQTEILDPYNERYRTAGNKDALAWLDTEENIAYLKAFLKNIEEYREQYETLVPAGPLTEACEGEPIVLKKQTPRKQRDPRAEGVRDSQPSTTRRTRSR